MNRTITRNIFRIRFFLSLIMMLFSVSILASDQSSVVRVYLNVNNVFYFNKAILKPTPWSEMAYRYNLSQEELMNFNGLSYREDAIINKKQINVPVYFSVNLLPEEARISNVAYLPTQFVIENSVSMSSFISKLNNNLYSSIKRLNYLEDNDVLRKGQALFLGYFRVNLQYGLTSFGKSSPKRYNYPTSPKTSVSQSSPNSQYSTNRNSSNNTIQSNTTRLRQNTFSNVDANNVNSYSSTPTSSFRPAVVIPSAFSNNFPSNSTLLTEKTCKYLAYETLLPESDDKFYALFDNTTVGSIIKITNKRNNRVVYAKVANALPKTFVESDNTCLLISALVQRQLQSNDGNVLTITFEPN